MRNKVYKVKVITLRDFIEAERTRLKRMIKRDKAWWNDLSRSDWARREFGDTLDGEINSETLRCQMESCQGCGKDFSLDERFLRLEFSFCSEYDCEMNVCLKCLGKMTEIMK